MDKITTPCAGCFSRLKTASLELKDPAMRESLKDLGIISEGAETVQVAHLLQVMLEEVGLDKIKQNVVKPLRD